MAFLITSWWIWLIVAVVLDILAILALFVVGGYWEPALGFFTLIGLLILSFIPWILFIIGGLAALINVVKG